MKYIFLFFIAIISCTQARAQHQLPALGYDYNALEPYIDSMTMYIHYNKHHQGYVNNLNKALTPKEQKIPIEQLLENISSYSDAVRNNAGGFYNHSLFWTMLTPNKNSTASTTFEKEVAAEFGSLDSLKAILNREGLGKFGSGWVWLVVTPDKKMKVCSTSNQDNPLMDDAKVKGIPILGIDLWEHAYYLKYQNKRGDYLSAIWNVFNWEEVGNRYLEAIRQ